MLDFADIESFTKMQTHCGHEKQKKSAKSFIQNDLALLKKYPEPGSNRHGNESTGV